MLRRRYREKEEEMHLLFGGDRPVTSYRIRLYNLACIEDYYAQKRNIPVSPMCRPWGGYWAKGDVALPSTVHSLVGERHM